MLFRSELTPSTTAVVAPTTKNTATEAVVKSATKETSVKTTRYVTEFVTATTTLCPDADSSSAAVPVNHDTAVAESVSTITSSVVAETTVAEETPAVAETANHLQHSLSRLLPKPPIKSQLLSNLPPLVKHNNRTPMPILLNPLSLQFLRLPLGPMLFPTPLMRRDLPRRNVLCPLSSLQIGRAHV